MVGISSNIFANWNRNNCIYLLHNKINEGKFKLSFKNLFRLHYQNAGGFYLPITHYSEWHSNNSVENRDTGITNKLLNAQENAKNVAGYLAYIIDLWER